MSYQGFFPPFWSTVTLLLAEKNDGTVTKLKPQKLPSKWRAVMRNMCQKYNLQSTKKIYSLREDENNFQQKPQVLPQLTDYQYENQMRHKPFVTVLKNTE